MYISCFFSCASSLSFNFMFACCPLWLFTLHYMSYSRLLFIPPTNSPGCIKCWYFSPLNTDLGKRKQPTYIISQQEKNMCYFEKKISSGLMYNYRSKWTRWTLEWMVSRLQNRCITLDLKPFISHSNESEDKILAIKTWWSRLKLNAPCLADISCSWYLNSATLCWEKADLRLSLE